MAKKRKPQPLSDAQREIMEIVWERGEISAFELREILGQRREVTRETVRTLLRRTEEKGWLKHRVVGRTYFYSALIKREANLRQHIQRLVDEYCDGSAERLMSALLDDHPLSEQEADRIQQMLDQARKNRQ